MKMEFPLGIINVPDSKQMGETEIGVLGLCVNYC